MLGGGEGRDFFWKKISLMKFKMKCRQCRLKKFVLNFCSTETKKKIFFQVTFKIKLFVAQKKRKNNLSGIKFTVPPPQISNDRSLMVSA